MKINEMIKDLEPSKFKETAEVMIYCANCDCSDTYRGATITPTEAQIVINKG